MKILILWFNFCALIAFFGSCKTGKQDNGSLLTHALAMAGENRTALEKVLQHYASPADSLKKEAAIFLINYMPGKFAKIFPAYDSFKPAFDTLAALNEAYEYGGNNTNLEFYKYYKHTVFNDFVRSHSIKLDGNLPYFIKEDIKTITADYLIENIEYAFKAWDLPWNKTLSFSDFCEYILPYRYGNEELTPWRKAYFEENLHLLDSFKQERDPLPVCMAIKGLHDITRSEIAELKALGNAIKPLDLIRINTTTSCQDETGGVMLRLRALGIPIARLRFPNWGNWGSGHDINGVLTLEKEWFPLSQGTNPDRYVPPRQFKIAKAFAETYSYDQETSAVGVSGGQYAMIQHYKDATGSVAEVSDVEVSFNAPRSNSQGCLCVFNNAEWIPIVCKSLSGRGIRFPAVGKGVVYMKGILKDGSLTVHGQPFLLNDEGKTVNLDALDSQITLTLDRKYPPNEELISFVPTLAGSYFQGANRADFSDAATLWTIDSLSSLHKMHKSVEHARYRYIRFVFADIERKNEALGGIQLYNTEGTQLKGTPVSTIAGSPTFYRHVFDNSPFTFVRLLAKKYADFQQFYDGESLVIPDNQPFWVGLDFGTEQDIASLEISPRTDDNDINVGETYELFYWGNEGWNSLGKKIATDTHLTYTAPEGALYLLKNAEKGREHRIFQYVDNTQVWH
ncbi:hypothetical protein [Parapedobacter koreensis]|uniref:F5/8 type C domain-containing protein n=1 Tax=Parapedobacter koreensis TaxID=332977 RepID=A0A1H7F8Z2_9SPHI|nr:hypothetical protein [Parapedobacter koreensis]SEK19685.1 hypothetical protein SAMN05421740_101170 [Parapedobacter koreensis]